MLLLPADGIRRCVATLIKSSQKRNSITRLKKFAKKIGGQAITGSTDKKNYSEMYATPKRRYFLFLASLSISSNFPLNSTGAS